MYNRTIQIGICGDITSMVYVSCFLLKKMGFPKSGRAIPVLIRDPPGLPGGVGNLRCATTKPCTACWGPSWVVTTGRKIMAPWPHEEWKHVFRNVFFHWENLMKIGWSCLCWPMLIIIHECQMHDVDLALARDKPVGKFNGVVTACCPPNYVCWFINHMN